MQTCSMSERAVDWRNLPGEIFQAIGLHLDAPSWAAARSSCKAWSSVTWDIRLLQIDLERSAHRWMMVVTCVARLFPRLSGVKLLVGHRITPTILAERMEALSISGIKLQELEVRFFYGSRPLIGSWLEDLSGLTHLKQLQVIRLGGGVTPVPSFFEQLRSLQRLTVLEVMPGAYVQLFDELNVGTAAAAGYGALDDGGLCDCHLAAIAQLTQLKQLTVKVNHSQCTVEGFRSLASSGLLSRLEQLALYDSALPAGCLAGCLKGAANLTELQLGLSNVDDLAALGKLPKLKALGLDTAFLPELRELVYAAARGSIPATGPGALTGLCLLDQTVGSPLQLASLSQLSSLAELVLVNPLTESAVLSEYEASEAARHPSQHLSPTIDISTLSGLRALRLLQIDRKSLPPPDWDTELNPTPPLQLHFSVTGVQKVASVWEQLVTLDLTGYGPDVLPAEAVSLFSQFRALRHLTIIPDMPAGSGDQPPASQRDMPSSRRQVAWWQLPKGLCTLALGHFDLTGSSSAGSWGSGGFSCTRQDAINGCCLTECCCKASVKHRLQCKPYQQLDQGSSTCNQPGPSSCGGSSSNSLRCGSKEGRHCSSVPAVKTSGQRPALAPASGARPSPAATELVSAATGGCVCTARLHAFFSSLQTLWLNHCKLPHNLLAAGLQAAAHCLNSLALLQVTGTSQPELAAALSGLSGLSSLTLVSLNHPLCGLTQLLPMRQLKQLHVKLVDLQPDDLTVLQQLRSLLCLSLTAQLGADGQPRPGLQSAVRLDQVVDIVQEHLPYCDVELHAETAAH